MRANKANKNKLRDLSNRENIISQNSKNKGRAEGKPFVINDSEINITIY